VPIYGPIWAESEMSGQTPRKTVGIVDDDPEMRTGIQRLLNAHGFATRVYESGEGFLDLDAASEVDCLLLDIHLGGMSGIELRRALKASGSTLPIIFMTAFDDEATRKEATEAGCVAYLRKPFEGKLLVAALAKAAR
jgi:FixJ family two-component response regulator